MKNKVFYLTLSLIFSILLVSAFGNTDIAKKDDYLIPHTVLRDGGIKIHAWFLQLKPGKAAVITRVAKKSQVKIEDINIKSPSGLTYKAKSFRNMPLKDLKEYLITARLFKNYFELIWHNHDISSLFINDVYASSCGQGEGHSGEKINLGPLISLADKSPWVSVGLFDFNEEIGNWEAGAKYDKDGKIGRAKGNFVYSAESPREPPGPIDFENLLGGPLK